MRIFVAGSTGALGRPLVEKLVAEGHEVFGLTRDGAKRGSLEAVGATAVIGDVLSAPAMKAALGEVAPEAVVQILNALPDGGPRRFSDLDQTNVLRSEGTRNLLAAATGAGVKRYVAESMIFGYGGNLDGRPFTEEAPFAGRSHVPELQPALDALRSLEEQVIGATREGRIEGIVLRFGLFYGPTAGSSRYAAKLLKRRMLPLPGGGTNRISLIHLDDAVTAIIAALDNGEQAGVYNITDDEPVSMHDYMNEFARVIGAKSPMNAPRWVARLAGKYVALMTSGSLTASNEKAKSELGWKPAYPTYRDGLPTLGASS